MIQKKGKNIVIVLGMDRCGHLTICLVQAQDTNLIQKKESSFKDPKWETLSTSAVHQSDRRAKAVAAPVTIWVEVHRAEPYRYALVHRINAVIAGDGIIPKSLTVGELMRDDGSGEAFVIDVDRIILAATGHVVTATRQPHKVLVVGVSGERTRAYALFSYQKGCMRA